MTLAGSFAAQVVLFCAVGFALGVMNFQLLRHNTELYLAPDRRSRAFVLHATRLTLVVAALVLVARVGGAALVAAFVGLLASRHAVAALARRSA